MQTIVHGYRSLAHAHVLDSLDHVGWGGAENMSSKVLELYHTSVCS